jgi:hypothetical protein
MTSTFIKVDAASFSGCVCRHRLSQGFDYSRIVVAKRLYTGQFSGAERWSGWSWQIRENAVNSLFVRVGLLPTAGHTPKLTKTSKDTRQCSHKALEIRYLLVQDGVSEQ